LLLNNVRAVAKSEVDRPDVGSEMIFSSMTILKILFVNIAAALF